MLPFESTRRQIDGVRGWLRTVRQLDRMPVKELAARTGVLKREILRLEIAEMQGQITLARLRQTAEEMGYDVVYAFIPKETALEELAQREMAARKKIREERIREREGKRNAERYRRRYGDVSALTILALEVKRALRKSGFEVVGGKMVPRDAGRRG